MTNAATSRNPAADAFWAGLAADEQFSLFCAYPKSGFIDGAEAGIRQACAAHSKLYTM